MKKCNPASGADNFSSSADDSFLKSIIDVDEEAQQDQCAEGRMGPEKAARPPQKKTHFL